MKRRMVAILLSAAVLASLAGCGQKGAQNNDQPKAQEKEEPAPETTQTSDAEGVAVPAGTAGSWVFPS